MQGDKYDADDESLDKSKAGSAKRFKPSTPATLFEPQSHPRHE